MPYDNQEHNTRDALLNDSEQCPVHDIPYLIRHREGTDNINTYADLYKLIDSHIGVLLYDTQSAIDEDYTYNLVETTYIWAYLPKYVRTLMKYHGMPEGARVETRKFQDILELIEIHYCYIDNELYCTDDEEVTYCDDCEEYFRDEDCQYHESSGLTCCLSCYEDRVNSDEDWDHDPDLPFIHSYHWGGANIKRHDLEPSDTLDLSIPGLSRFGIGFEVEKANVDGRTEVRQNIEEQPLFSHWETDSSCGVEGITHVYNLADYDKFNKHVNRSDYVNSDVNNRCGGHTNISYRGQGVDDPFELTQETITQHTGILYALFKKRLLNDYCRYNKKLDKPNQSGRYCCVVSKSGRLEFRLPSRIKNGGQLLRRFKLFQVYIAHIYSYHVHKYEYQSTMHTINSRLDLQYGERTLYRNLRHDDFFNTSFFKSDTYKRIRFLIHDMCKYLDVSYRNRPASLANTVIDAYLFQAWLDDNGNACLLEDEFTQYLRDHSSTNPLTIDQRAFFNDVPYEHRINNIHHYTADVTTNEHENVLNNT